MDGERRDGDGGRVDPEVLDEFACAGLLRGSLTSLHGSVERIFGVFFDIGMDNLSQGNNEPIWLKLQGKSNNVKAAKLFVKGVVNPEEQQEVSYPGVLHCVFCGARGLFMDCLIRSTSAHIVIGSSGYLLISGLAEPVVRAYSLITDFAERYEGTHSGRSEVGDRVSGELLDSRRAFKILVEKWEDKHILDLLVLPASVKDILLDLVKESGFDSNSSLALMQEGRWDSTSHHRVDRMGASSIQDSATKDSLFQSVTPSEERLVRFPQEVEEEEQLEQVVAIGTQLAEGEGEVDQELQFVLLLKFFTAMGYTDDVVKRVLARTGPKEASQILDLVQQEQDHSDQEQSVDHGHDQKDEDREMNQHCDTVHNDNEGIAAGGDMLINNDGDRVDVCEEEGHLVHGCSRQLKGEGSAEKKEKGQEEDFVLGVLKKAAASCGYMEQKVAKVYNMLPDGSTHQLLLELQRDGSNEGGALLEEPREMEDVLLKGGGATVGPLEGETRGEIDRLIAAERRKTDDKGWVVLPKLTVPVSEPDVFTWINKPQQATTNQYKPQPKHHQPPKAQTQHRNGIPEVKGPPLPTYSSSSVLPHTNIQSDKQYSQISYQPTFTQNYSTQDNVLNPEPPSCNSLKRSFQVPQPSTLSKDSSASRAGEIRGFVAASSVAVTGEQRFLEGLQLPFGLKLTDEPGDPKLRTVIIDASNVAMSHGLGHFFSCRGIALAVQHFWDRGHRNICALLPQWRQKSDSKAKEQHYLGQLQKLGLVSYTPSREVQGKRIMSYDDRFMLQLSEKTNGVIVTNDNLRDLSDESPVWTDIIKKRLLQYTFVGDHFMVPDDPLGRGGPHLDDFLRLEHRTPPPVNPSSTTFPSFKTLRSQNEVPHLRDRAPAQDARHRGSRGKWSGKDCDMRQQHRQYGADRSPEETASLRKQLCNIFASQDSMVALVLQCHPAETDVNVLSHLILELEKD